jgi:hypothetical protein
MLSATWAQRPELSAVLSQLLTATTPSEAKRTLHAQENRFELAYAARNRVAQQGQTGGSVRAADMITSRKRLMALGNLQHSMVGCGRLSVTDRELTGFCSAGSWCTSRGCALPRRRLASRLPRLW